MTGDRFRSLANGQTVTRTLRVAFVGLLVFTLLSAGVSYAAYDPVAETNTAAGGADGTTAGDRSVQPSADPRVVAVVDGVGPGQLVAYDANGSVVYHNESWWIYHDVDPSPVGEDTVTYVASGIAEPDTCPGEECLRNAIERVNLTTGEVTHVYDWTNARNGSSQTHDVDRVNESVYLVADISFPDQVYMVNVTSGEVVWQWNVSEAYEPESGGSYPSDWTHLNDVEYLHDGRVMVSLRNQDQVVFVEPGEGLQENWTLGSDDNHTVLYEQHNPDYIPEERGGPAVVVADSENNRLVEYQRVDGDWERTWHWQDTTMQWPRDADRLPSGRTLVADSHGQRLMSISPDGSIAWSHDFPTGSYDVELLGTGDESAGGESAASLGLTSRTLASPVSDGNTSMRANTVGPSVGDETSTTSTTASGTTVTTGNESDETAAAAQNGERPGGGLGARLDIFVYSVVSLVPPLVLHGLLYSLPTWAGPVDAVLVLATGLVGAVWVVAEVGVRALARLRASGEG